jgi:hypothetical protein
MLSACAADKLARSAVQLGPPLGAHTVGTSMEQKAKD